MGGIKLLRIIITDVLVGCYRKWPFRMISRKSSLIEGPCWELQKKTIQNDKTLNSLGGLISVTHKITPFSLIFHSMELRLGVNWQFY